MSRTNIISLICLPFKILQAQSCLRSWNFTRLDVGWYILWRLGSKNSTSYTKFVFFRLIGKTRCLPRLWLVETFSSSLSEIAERNIPKLDRKQELNILYQVCVFWPIGKQEVQSMLPLIGWDILEYSSGLTERNLIKLDKKQLSTQRALPIFRFCADRKTKITALANSSRKVTYMYCTLVHDMWPFGHLVYFLLQTPPS